MNQVRNFFSQPWKQSDVALIVEDNEFHVHRSILSLQSPVFKEMFGGNFKDGKQDKIELKDDNHEAMIHFLKLLYPISMLGENVKIDDDNIFGILKVADKYAAIDVIKQCMKEASKLRPTNTMRLLPYAIRNELPLETIIDVIARHVSTNELEKFAPELDNEPIYARCLLAKCRYLEKQMPMKPILWR